MRKEIFRMGDADARAMLDEARELTVSALDAESAPMIRVVNTVLLDGAIYFHGAPAGEKMESLGKQAVCETSRVVARIPSYFVDPVRACPATTLYESVQAHGALAEVTARDEKARVLTALLAKLQPEGGHEPMSADSDTYRKALEGLLVVRMQITHIDGKRKVGQNRRPEERTRLLAHLFERGDEGDARAIESVIAHCPDTPLPEGFCGPNGSRFLAELPQARHTDALALLRTGAYWLDAVPDAEVLSSMRASQMVGAIDRQGALVATARILTDTRVAWIFDVLVERSLRGTGLGRALMRFVLAHPCVRRARNVRLTTRDKDAFYRRLGFAELSEAPRHSWRSIEMIRHQNAGA